MSNQLERTNNLKAILDRKDIKENFMNVLKEESTIFTASIIDLYNNDTNLSACDPNAIVMEAFKAASLKIPLSRGLGFGYIVPYRKGDTTIPQFQMGYKGFIQLALRTGQYEAINADVVYEGELTFSDKLTGSFKFDGTATSDKIAGYFAHIQLKNGFSKTLYMTVAQVTSHAKKYSKTFNSSYSPWKTDFDSMAIKTVLKSLISKYGVLSIELGTLMENEVEEEINNNANTVEILPITTATVVEEKPEVTQPRKNAPF